MRAALPLLAAAAIAGCGGGSSPFAGAWKESGSLEVDCSFDALTEVSMDSPITIAAGTMSELVRTGGLIGCDIPLRTMNDHDAELANPPFSCMYGGYVLTLTDWSLTIGGNSGNEIGHGTVDEGGDAPCTLAVNYTLSR